MTDRRRFLVGLAAASIARPSTGADRAVKRVGAFGRTGGGVFTHWEATLAKSFEPTGFVAGRNLDLRFYGWGPPAGAPHADYSAEQSRRDGARMAERMARDDLDCMIVNGDQATRLLAEATRTVPIVAFVGDPVALRFAQSLARPGGNVTGVHSGAGEVALKTLELIKRVAPATSGVAWIGFANFRFAADSLEAVAPQFGLRVKQVLLETSDVRARDTAIAALRRLRSEGFQAVVAGESEPQFMAVAMEQRLVVCAGDYTSPGVLFHYRTTALTQPVVDQRMPAIAARILRGESPARIPFEGPATYGLYFNLATAAKLGIDVPPDVQVRATELFRG